jgi:hypothetical protein
MAAKQPWDNDEEVRGPWEADPDYSGPSVADYADDIIASLATGINKGAAGAPGLGGDIGYAGDWLLDKMGVTDNKYVRNVLNPGRMLPNSATTIKAWENFSGELPRPKTGAGTVAETVGTFIVPMPGSKLERGASLARNVGEGVSDLVKGTGAGLASEYAGEKTKGTALEPVARFAGALAGGTAGHYASLPSLEGIGRLSTQRLKSVVPTDGGRLNDLTGPSMVLDASPATTRLAAGVATNGGAPMDTIVGATARRDLGRSARLEEDANGLLGPASSTETLRTRINRDVRNRADPLYGRAYRSGADLRGYGPVIDQMFTDVFNSSGSTQVRGQVQRYSNQVAEILRDGNSQRVIARLHDLRQEMDRAANWNPRTSTTAAPPTHVQQAARNTRAIIDDVLKTEVPGFSQADAIVERGATRKEAVDYGASVLDGGKTAVWPEDLARDLSRTKGPSRSAAGRQTRIPQIPRADVRAGARADIQTSMGTQANDLAALSKKLGAENDFNRAKMNELFGETPTTALGKRLDDERLYAQNNSDIWRGAQTAGRSEASKFLNPSIADAYPASTSFTGIGANLLARGIDRLTLSPSTIPRIAEMLTREGPEARALVRQLSETYGLGIVPYIMEMAGKSSITTSSPVRGLLDEPAPKATRSSEQ